MGWFSKIFKSPRHKVFEDKYDTRNGTGSMDDKSFNSGDTVGEIEDIDHAIALSLAEAEHEGKNVVDYESQLEEDEQLAIALQESLVCQSPPRNGNVSLSLPRNGDVSQSPPQTGNIYQSPPQRENRVGSANGHSHGGENMYQPIHFPYSAGFRICAGCNTHILHGRILSCMGAVWHPECFRCHACNQPITDHEFSTYGNYPHHKACYKEHYHPKCDVCKNLIPTNSAGYIEYRAHPFWSQKYCPVHELDGTLRCCSCERLEPHDVQYVALDDGRKLCLECLDSVIMDTNQCQPLYIDIQEFYESLNMKVEQQVPLLLVERQALNEAMDGEKHGHHHLPETRGLCLSEEQTISTISRRPRIGVGNRAVDMRTEPYKLTRRCEVTAILILYGLPRLLTGSILAHEMMHAWLRLKGYQTLGQDVEEGICQVLARMWLESEGVSTSENSASTSSSSYPSSQGTRSPFERKLGEFFKHQIEADTSPIYGNGYRAAKEAVVRHGLQRTLDHIHMTGTFPR